MKLLFCQDCSDIVSPLPVADEYRRCRCGRHALWWSDPAAGTLRLFDAYCPPKWIEEHKYPTRPRAYVLGITNALLAYPGEGMSKEIVQQLVDEHPETYLFRQQRSLIVRFRPGATGDTAWAATLPLPP